jgi:hypothetical protein
MAAIVMGPDPSLESRLDSPTNALQRKAVPRPDPLPRPPADHLRRLKRSFQLLGWFSVLVAVIATLLVARGQDGFHPHMLIATALGIGLAVFIGGALMLLIFFSASSGHDEAASRYDPKDEQ